MAVLPVAFPRLRLLCLAVLSFGIVLHMTHLVALHRLIAIRGGEQLNLQVGGPIAEGFEAATSIAQQLSQAQIPFFLCLCLALTFLAAAPSRPSAKRLLGTPEIEAEETNGTQD